MTEYLSKHSNNHSINDLRDDEHEHFDHSSQAEINANISIGRTAAKPQQWREGSGAVMVWTLSGMALAACVGPGKGGGGIAGLNAVPGEALVTDGPVRGAAVYFDLDGDGFVTAEERALQQIDGVPQHLTNAEGIVVVPAGLVGARFVADVHGAIDTGTGAALSGEFYSDSEGRIASPLTDLVNQLHPQLDWEANEATVQGVIDRVFGADSGITPEDLLDEENYKLLLSTPAAEDEAYGQWLISRAAVALSEIEKTFDDMDAEYAADDAVIFISTWLGDDTTTVFGGLASAASQGLSTNLEERFDNSLEILAGRPVAAPQTYLTAFEDTDIDFGELIRAGGSAEFVFGFVDDHGNNEGSPESAFHGIFIKVPLVLGTLYLRNIDGSLSLLDITGGMSHTNIGDIVPENFPTASTDYIYVSTSLLDTLVLRPEEHFNGSLALEFRVFDGEESSQIAEIAFTIITVEDFATQVSLTPAITRIAQNADFSEALKVADIAISGDPDEGGSGTLVLTGDDAASFEIVGTELFLKAGAAVNVPGGDALDVRVQLAEDNTVFDDYTLSVTPTLSISLSRDSFAFDEGDNGLITVFLATVTAVGGGTDPYSVSEFSLSGDTAADSRFQIVAGDAPNTFTLETVSGVSFNYDAGDTSFTLTLELSGATQTFTVTINDVAEPLAIDLVPTTSHLSDDILTLARVKVADIVFENADSGSTYTFELVGDDAELFEVIGTELFLKAGTALNAATNPSLNVSVRWTGDTSISDDLAITVNHAVDIGLTAIKTILNEGAVPNTGTIELLPGVSVSINPRELANITLDTNGSFDADDFTITGDAANRFEVVAGTGANAFVLQTVEGASFDHDAGDTSFTLTISVGSTSTTYTLTVVDQHDEAPVITSGATGAVLAENTEVSTSTAVYTATGTYDRIPITWVLTGTDADLFDIDATSGAVTFKEATTPDFEAKSAYSFNVVALSGSLAVTQQAVTVSVSNVDEPIILSLSSAVVQIPEEFPESFRVKVADINIFNALDPSSLTLQLVGADADKFEIDRDGLFLKVQPPLEEGEDFVPRLDATLNPSLDVRVQLASDSTIGDDLSIEVTHPVTINNIKAISTVLNEGVVPDPVRIELIPGVFTDPIDPAKLAEITLTTSGSFDADDFTVTGDDQNRFEIVADTGANAFILQTVDGASFDYEAGDTKFFLTISVGGTSTTYTVNVFNANDEAPVITSGAIGIPITHNVEVLAHEAFYVATGTYDTAPIVWSIKGADASLLNIDKDSGVVTFKTDTTPDMASKSSYSFTIVATSGTLDPVEQAVTVNVTDVTFSISYDRQFLNEADDLAATRLASVAVNSNRDFTADKFTIVGDEQNRFEIVANLDGDGNALKNSFRLQTVQDADFDYDAGDTSFTLAVSIDGVTQTYTLTVIDINDEAPVITSGATGGELTDNVEVSTSAAVYTAAATPDLSSGVIVWSIKGSDSDLFNIDDSTGVVTFKAATTPDVATKSLYSFTVVATSGSQSAEQAVIIEVDDDDPATAITLSPWFNAILETTRYSYDANIATAYFTDPDGGSHGEIELAGEDKDLFQFHRNGIWLQLKANTELNAAENPTLDVRVQLVSDPTVGADLSFTVVGAASSSPPAPAPTVPQAEGFAVIPDPIESPEPVVEPDII